MDSLDQHGLDGGRSMPGGGDQLLGDGGRDGEQQGMDLRDVVGPGGIDFDRWQE
jgi:hypothetical protein